MDPGNVTGVLGVGALVIFALGASVNLVGWGIALLVGLSWPLGALSVILAGVCIFGIVCVAISVAVS